MIIKIVVTIPELLLVSQADLAGVVDLSPKSSVVVQGVLAADPEAGVVAAGGPVEGDSAVQLGGHLLVDGASKVLPIIAANKQSLVLYTYNRYQNLITLLKVESLRE